MHSPLNIPPLDHRLTYVFPGEETHPGIFTIRHAVAKCYKFAECMCCTNVQAIALPICAATSQFGLDGQILPICFKMSGKFSVSLQDYISYRI